MIQFLYPGDAADPVLRQHNAAFSAGTLGTKGVLSLAVDVWRDNAHLFRSYALEQSETLDDWARRNYPTIEHPEYKALPMGVPLGVAGVDQYPVPTRAALTGRFTFEAAVDYLKALLATAQHPFGPERLDELVPKANAMRQRLHHAERGWVPLRVLDSENNIAIRAVVVHVGGMMESRPMAEYEASVGERESSIDHALAHSTARFNAPWSALDEASLRRPVVKAAKKALGLVGLHSVVSEEQENLVVHRLTAHPNNLTIRRIGEPQSVEVVTQMGIDVAA